MVTNNGKQKLLATGSLGTSVNLAPFDELVVQNSWEEVPNRIWVSGLTSFSPTLNVGLPRDSHRRQVVLTTLDTALSTTETGVGNVDDLVSILSILGCQIEPGVSSVLTIAGLGTRFAKSIEIRGIVGREKIVVMHCPDCSHIDDFGSWNLNEAQEKAETCPECGSEIDDEDVTVI